MAELFAIRAGAVQLVWSRRQDRAVPVVAGGAGPPFGLVVEPAPGAAPPETVIPEMGIPEVGAPEARPGRSTPLLFEQTDYVLFVQSSTGAPVGVRHRDPNLIAGLHASDGGRVVHGVVNFGTQVGRSRFVVEAAGRPVFAFEVEVFPSKIDYRSDYEALRTDVQDVTAALVLEYLRATYRPAAAWPAATADVPGWVFLLGHVLDDLEHAMAYVAAHPQWGTARVLEAVRAEQVRRPDGAVRRALRRAGPEGVVGGGPAVPARLPARPARHTLDTPEHRWLHARLRHVGAGLDALVAAERRQPPVPRRLHVLGELERLRRRVDRLRRQAPLAAVADVPPPAPPMRLVAAPGYREAYRACLALEQGLHLEGGPVGLALKDLHLLYEYWCFLTLVRLAAAVAGRPLPAARLLAAERHGLRYRLRRGRRHAVRLGLPGGRRLTLVYNPRFGGRGYLVPQQPDFVLTLRHADGTRTHYIVDAKYRLDAGPAYVRRYGTPGPPVDALNTLHRYRDAIRDRTAGRRSVVEAVALFPYREAAPGAYAESRHGCALEEVGVGALPLLPGATHYLAAWLRRILAET